jgi:subtilisin family serine protease
MKNIISNLVFLCIFVVSAQAQESVFYYDELGEKIYLEKNSGVKFIYFANETTIQNHSLFNQLKTQNVTIDTLSQLMYKVTGNFKQKTISNLLLSEQTDSNILYISDMLLYEGSMLWESDKIIVKIFPNTEISYLLETNHIPYREFKRLGSNPQTYIVTLDISQKSAIEYANSLVENKLVVIAQPSFWRSIQLDNPYFSSQWGLQNTGQYDGTAGVDIKATYAWELADGSGIKIAVIDEGVDLMHPDLVDNLLPGYDATDGMDRRPPATSRDTYGGYGGWWNNDSHGTACAGIISARNNDMGIIGIAYNAKIIPIRNFYGERTPTIMSKDEWTVDAIQWAWKNGADILSCSWHITPSFVVTDEIDNAVTLGRGGKGCIVIFAAGNENKSIVSYPAYLPNVIAVGAISPCGERKRSSRDPNELGMKSVQPDPAGVSCDGEKSWGSNYGQALDVMAPGVLVPTTDIQGNAGYNPNTPIYIIGGGNKLISEFSDQDYTVWFSGTSSACPHVAGVAALVLSVDPTLTGEQVKYIIKSTAQKIRPDLYAYNISNKSPYTLWNQEVGYGLIDAYAAVQAAKCTKSSFDLMIGDTPDDAGTEPNFTPKEDILDCPNIWVENTNTTARQFAKQGESNHIYIRIKNNSCHHYVGSDSISLYWSKGGTDLSWPEKWDGSNPLLGNHIETIKLSRGLAPFGEYIEDMYWRGNQMPDLANYSNFSDPGHFYLLAKIKSGNDALAFSETADLERNVRNNNNIACRSIRIGSGVDLMIKDTKDDNGIEPNPTSSDMWQSPDIWVRNQNPDDAIEHQNPIGNRTNYVHVRIKNVGKMPSHGEEELFLYWSKASANLSWPGQWDGSTSFAGGLPTGGLIPTTQKIPQLQPGQETILIIPWEVPDTNIYSGITADPWHFCLLARISSANIDPMSSPETSNINKNTRENNNIAWKNVTVVENQESQQGAIVIGNWDFVPRTYSLRFVDDGIIHNDRRIYEEAEITAKLNDVLFTAWRRGGMQGINVSLGEERIVRITGENARLDNLIFEPNELGILVLGFNFYSEECTQIKGYSIYNIILSDATTEEVIGGEVYYVYRSPIEEIEPDVERFTANAGADIYADKGDRVVLCAERVREEAAYEWYDQNGRLLWGGMEFITEVIEEQKYQLKVTARSDGFIAYDEVMIKLKPNRIESIYPNPTDDRITVVYKINKAGHVYLGITPANYFSLSMRYLYIEENSITLYLREYPPGIYIIFLNCDGEIVDYKTVIRY